MKVDWVELVGSDGVTNVLTCSDEAVQTKKQNHI